MDMTSGIQTLATNSVALYAFLVYVAACIMGQVGNAVWLWLGKEIPCILDRFKTDPRSTVKAFLSNLGVVLSLAILIPFDGMNWKVAVILGLMQGLSADSKLNASTRKIWTEEEREAKTTPIT